MSTSVPSREDASAGPADGASNFEEVFRATVRAEIQNALNLDSLKEELRDELSSGASAGPCTESDLGSLFVENAAEVFAQEPVRAAINGMIQEALQSVLPSLVKRFRSEMQNAFTDLGGGVNIEEVVNSAEMKEMLEDRFRHMLMYLKQDIIPKAIQG